MTPEAGQALSYDLNQIPTIEVLAPYIAIFAIGFVAAFANQVFRRGN